MAKDDLLSFVEELEASQELLWASDTHAVLVVLQAMDVAGKDGTIKHVMSGVKPQGCQVVAFKQPSAEELGHASCRAAGIRACDSCDRRRAAIPVGSTVRPALVLAGVDRSADGTTYGAGSQGW